MPTYCFKLPSGRIREAIIPIAEMEKGRGKFTFEDGKTGVRDLAAEFAPCKQTTAAWPMVSRAAAVHPSQIREAKEHARRRGVNVDFDKKGNVILASPKNRERYLKTRGMHDTGYSCDVRHAFR